MGNASVKEDDSSSSFVRSNDDSLRDPHAPTLASPVSSDSMTNSPSSSPPRSRSPLIFAPQVPVAPLQPIDGPSSDQMWQTEVDDAMDVPQRRIPTLITWNYGGNDVAVEGSWDNWKSRKTLQRAGKDHTILLVLPSGIYHYKFIVDGEHRYIPDLPSVADDVSGVCNLLDVNDYVPENLDSVAEFEVPSSPDSSYCQAFPGDEDYAKEPVPVPSQLHETVLGGDSDDESSSPPRPQHVVLNHLFIEKGWASQSVVALGMTNRFQSKYVTVVLYKPLNR